MVRGGVTGQFPKKDPDGIWLDINPMEFLPLLRKPYNPYFLPFGNDTYEFIPYWRLVDDPQTADLELYDQLFNDSNPAQIGCYHFEKLNLTQEGAEIQYIIQYDNVTTLFGGSKFCTNVVSLYGSCVHIVESTMLNYINHAFGNNEGYYSDSKC